jgi:predicted RNA-binding Zn ribbon-like protein
LAVEPGHRLPAPAPLRLIQELVNTRDVMERTDSLATRDALHAWALERDLLDGRDVLTVEGYHRALEVREALRGLLLENNGAQVDAGAAAALEAAAADAAITISFKAPSHLPQLVAQASGIDRLLGTILLAIYEASCSGQWRRLKACREPTCQWAFYDHSRNSGSHWCTMSMCGGRAKARAYRQRKRGGDSTTKASRGA